MNHRFVLQLRFGDFDSAGIVYFPRYLHFCHVGMEEYFREVVKLPYSEFLAGHRLGLPTVRSEVDYRRPLRYGDHVELEVAVVRVGASSVEWRHRFFLDGVERPAAEARVVTVLVDMSSFEKRDIPDWLRARMVGV